MKKYYFLAVALLVVLSVHAQWQSTNGPYQSSQYISMDMENIAVSGSLLCATISYRVYISDNFGASWKYASYGVNNAQKIAFKDSVIWAGGSGIYYSSNWGSTYKSVNTNLPASFQTRGLLISGNSVIAIIYDNNTYNDDIYYTNDNGNNWNLANGIHNKETKWLTSNGTTLYAAANYGGVYVSNDGGQNWTAIGPNNTTSISQVTVSGNKIFAGELSSSGALYYSSNNGSTWTLINSGLGSYLAAISCDNNYVYAFAFGGFYRSDNNGSSWTNIGGNPCSYTQVTQMVSDGTNLYICADYEGFSYSASHGESWRCSPYKTYDLNINSIASQKNIVIAAAAYSNNFAAGLFTSPDTGINWNRNLVSMNGVAISDSVVVAGGKNVQRSGDYGNSWNVKYVTDSLITNVVCKDSLFFAATKGKGIFFSHNYGSNWTQANNGLGSLSINTLSFTDSVLVAGSNNAGIFVSIDSGSTWSTANNGLLDTCIISLAGYNNIIYAGTRNHGIYTSFDKGAHWSQSNMGSGDTTILSLQTCGINVFAGISGQGFFMSTDSGQHWSSYNDGLLNYNVNAITDNGKDVFIGSNGYYLNGGGVWKRNLSEMPLAFSIKNISGARKICGGNFTTIEVAVVGGKSPYIYQWSNGGTSSSITVTPDTTTTYSLSIQDNNGNVLNTQTIVTVIPTPNAPTLIIKGDTLISSESAGNIWLFNGEIIPYEYGDTLIAYQDGIYSVYVESNNCKSDTSNNITLGIAEPILYNIINIYPNPAKNTLTLKAPLFSLVQIFNIQGKLILSAINDHDFVSLNISDLLPGLYFIRVKYREQSINGKFIKVD